jgi:hypothetical protein
MRSVRPSVSTVVAVGIGADFLHARRIDYGGAVDPGEDDRVEPLLDVADGHPQEAAAPFWLMLAILIKKARGVRRGWEDSHRPTTGVIVGATRAAAQACGATVLIR